VSSSSQALLGVGDEAAAELQLFSFCAASTLHPFERAHALNAVNTVERLQYTASTPRTFQSNRRRVI